MDDSAVQYFTVAFKTAHFEDSIINSSEEWHLAGSSMRPQTNSLHWAAADDCRLQWKWRCIGKCVQAVFFCLLPPWKNSLPMLVPEMWWPSSLNPSWLLKERQPILVVVCRAEWWQDTGTSNWVTTRRPKILKTIRGRAAEADIKPRSPKGLVHGKLLLGIYSCGPKYQF